MFSNTNKILRNLRREVYTFLHTIAESINVLYKLTNIIYPRSPYCNPGEEAVVLATAT